MNKIMTRWNSFLFIPLFIFSIALSQQSQYDRLESLREEIAAHKRKVDALQKELPMYRNIMETIGKPIVFNICMLGAVIALTKLVKPDSIMNVLQDRLPAGFIKMNRDALDLGMKIAADKETR